MSGETDLQQLLATLSPVLDPEPYGFVLCHAPATIIPIFALIHEAEGATVIARKSTITAQGLSVAADWARITLQVLSSLHAVGLTAVVSTALARAGISSNMVAAFHHDHIFVPWHRRDEAMTVLRGLQTSR